MSHDRAHVHGNATPCGCWIMIESYLYHTASNLGIGKHGLTCWIVLGDIKNCLLVLVTNSYHDILVYSTNYSCIMHRLIWTNFKECWHSNLINTCKVEQYIFSVKVDLKYCHPYHVHRDYNTSGKQWHLQLLNFLLYPF